MSIRAATPADGPAIRSLYERLGFVDASRTLRAEVVSPLGGP